MQDLLPLAEKLGALLKDRHETIAIAESSTGGLISAALLSVPGASAYFLGGAVVYTVKARRLLMDIQDAEKWDALGERTLLDAARARFEASWGLSETGATGPTGNRYGDKPGHTCIAIAGPVERAITLETGSADRVANMRKFAAKALDLLLQSINSAPH